MENKLRKNWFHIVVWGLMFVYLIFAPNLYVRFILKNGKPVQFSQELPDVTDQILSSVDILDPYISGGQKLYNLWGWAFMQQEQDQSLYERFIVLRSGAKKYFFPTQSFPRPDVVKHFPDLTFDVLNSGFSAIISKDVIPLGAYQIGIVFMNQSTKEVYYVVTDKILIRSANQLFLVMAASQP